MPILTIKIAAPPSPEISVKIATALTDLTVTILRKKRELTAVVIDYVAPAAWFIAGNTLAAQTLCSFSLDIKITEASNSKEEKAAFIAQVFSTMEGILGPLAPASYIILHDLQADSWGYQGLTQEFRHA